MDYKKIIVEKQPKEPSDSHAKGTWGAEPGTGEGNFLATEEYRERVKGESIAGSQSVNNGQATKSARGMPWHQEPTKDAAICEKPRGAESRHRSVDIRMGKPG